MRPRTRLISPAKLFPLCRLLAEDVSVSHRVQTSVVESLVHWWINATDEGLYGDLRTAMLLVSRSSCSGNLAERLVDAIDGSDPTLTDRTLEVLAHFPDSADSSMRLLLRVVRVTSGEARWLAASALAKLGMSDELILTQLSTGTAVEVRKPDPRWESRKVFTIREYGALYDVVVNATTAAEKGEALEHLAEYMFLCVPGLDTKARNLRTLAEEIDLAFSNQADGFWREVGSPFIVECRNLISPVSAKMIRDFVGKMRTKAMRTGFIVTTNHVTKPGIVEQRQSLREGITVISIDGRDLSRISTNGDLLRVFEERYFKCRLL